MTQDNDIIRELHTESGSIYELNLSRKEIRGRQIADRDTGSRRLTHEWKPYVTVCANAYGGLTVYWGDGADEHSALAKQIGIGEGTLRLTQTSRISKVVLETGHEVTWEAAGALYTQAPEIRKGEKRRKVDETN